MAIDTSPVCWLAASSRVMAKDLEQLKYEVAEIRALVATLPKPGDTTTPVDTGETKALFDAIQAKFGSNLQNVEDLRQESQEVRVQLAAMEERYSSMRVKVDEAHANIGKLNNEEIQSKIETMCTNSNARIASVCEKIEELSTQLDNKVNASAFDKLKTDMHTKLDQKLDIHTSLFGHGSSASSASQCTSIFGRNPPQLEQTPPQSSTPTSLFAQCQPQSSAPPQSATASVASIFGHQSPEAEIRPSTEHVLQQTPKPPCKSAASALSLQSNALDVSESVHFAMNPDVKEFIPSVDCTVEPTQVSPAKSTRKKKKTPKQNAGPSTFDPHDFDMVLDCRGQRVTRINVGYHLFISEVGPNMFGSTSDKAYALLEMWGTMSANDKKAYISRC